MTKGTVVEHATIWESPTDGVLRVFSKRTDSMPTVDMRASKLYVDRKFGETTLRCREFVGRVKSAGTMTLLMSTQSPQLIVSMEIDVVTDGVRMASIGKITDVAIVPFRPLATPTLPKR